MLEASVGVNQPRTKPERMISGVIRARMELPQKGLQTEGVPLIAAPDGVDIDQNHQQQTHQQARHDAAHEQLIHADAGHAAIDNQGD